jgi:hypothetical protein
MPSIRRMHAFIGDPVCMVCGSKKLEIEIFGRASRSANFQSRREFF